MSAILAGAAIAVAGAAASSSRTAAPRIPIEILQVERVILGETVNTPQRVERPSDGCPRPADLELRPMDRFSCPLNLHSIEENAGGCTTFAQLNAAWFAQLFCL